MTRPLIHRATAAAALALIATASTAQTAGNPLPDSSVQVYGIVDALARHANDATAAAGGRNTITDGAYTASRLGFRGREDLGSGLRAFFSLEQGFDPSTGALQQANATAGLGQSAVPGGRMFGREALVGLGSSTLGAITMGRQYTEAHLMSNRFQPQANPNDAWLSPLSVHHVARQDNMVRYAQQLGGFGFSMSAKPNAGSGKAWGASASYNGGSFDLVAYAQDMKTDAAGSDTRKIYGLGGRYDVTSSLKLYLGTMRREQVVSLQRNQVITAGFNYAVTGNLSLTGGYTDDHQTGIGIGHRHLGFLGPIYAFSKRTDVYAIVDNNQIDGLYPLPTFMAARGTQVGFSAGLRHRF